MFGPVSYPGIEHRLQSNYTANCGKIQGDGKTMENWKKWVHIACEIFTALGTVGAVWVSLWLALRNEKIRIKAAAILGQEEPPRGMRGRTWSCICISIINVGLREIKIKPTDFYYQTKTKKLRAFIPSPFPYEPEYKREPYSFLFLPLLNVQDFIKQIGPDNIFQTIKEMKIYYFSPAGEKIRIKTSKAFKAELKKNVEALLEISKTDLNAP